MMEYKTIIENCANCANLNMPAITLREIDYV